MRWQQNLDILPLTHEAAMHPQCALVLNYFFTCLMPDDFTRPLSRNAPYLFFTCLTPDDFTRQWGSSAEL